jgi:GH25 family lysozyme M1 (1,4-beta-N-acetylmuramidase)
MFTGPDVSEHQGDIDWGKVAKEHEFAMVRVSDGDVKDRFYSRARVDGVRKAGLLFGPYNFARVASPQNNQRDGAAEARMVLGLAKAAGWKWPGDLPLLYDFETDNGQPPEKCARHLLQFVRTYRKAENHYPGIYTMPGFWQRLLPHLPGDDRRLIRRCFLWQAEWGVDGPRRLEPWGEPVLWQWTDGGRSPGISGPVDMNRTTAPEKRLLDLAKRKDRPPFVGDEQQPPREDDAASDRPEGVPEWVSSKAINHWVEPWSDAAARSSAFRTALWRHGHLSPHFTRKEARCHDPQHTDVPEGLRASAQRHAFNLERLRHRLGDNPLPILSWYRTLAWNTQVGGVVNSRHLQADGTDFTVGTVNIVGSDRFDRACDQVFTNGGFGRYASGSRHADSRGSRARW